jgi:hypothetical protein
MPCNKQIIFYLFGNWSFDACIFQISISSFGGENDAPKKKEKNQASVFRTFCYGFGTDLSRAPAPNIALVRSASGAE